VLTADSPAVRLAWLASVWAAAVAPLSAQPGSLDPVFAQVSFDQWAAVGGQAQLRWTASVSHPRLSIHQRLFADVEIRLDGAELLKRRGAGEMLVLVQVTGRDGRRYQNHLAIDLSKVTDGAAKEDVVSIFSAFVTPGEYSVWTALYDTTTREHCVKQEKLQVAPLRNDPLPGAWRDLPPVEFLPIAEPPDVWYEPSVSGRLRLAPETRNPVRIEVVLNLTPSQYMSDSPETRSRNLSVLIPALKAISALGAAGAPLSVELLDLTRHRVAFRQDRVRDLDWQAIKQALAPAGSESIDLKSLEGRRLDAAFFVGEVGRVLGATHDEPSRVLVILSAPVAFDSGEDLHPIALDASSSRRVFYIRCHAPHGPHHAMLDRDGLPPPPGFSGARRRGLAPETPTDLSGFDQLASTLKPLAPRLFDVQTAEDFRKAMADVMAGIESLGSHTEEK
jgi:hypothetical protein